MEWLRSISPSSLFEEMFCVLVRGEGMDSRAPVGVKRMVMKDFHKSSQTSGWSLLCARESMEPVVCSSDVGQCTLLPVACELH